MCSEFFAKKNCLFFYLHKYSQLTICHFVFFSKGGGCRFCGSVEHLKSDCPRKVQKDAKSDVRAMKMNDHKDLEDEPIPSQPKKKFQPQKKQKVVSFWQ